MICEKMIESLSEKWTPFWTFVCGLKCSPMIRRLLRNIKPILFQSV